NVYISSERNLPSIFHKYILSMNPKLIHHAIYFSDLFISDSQSMTVESCILGTPSIRYSDFVGRISVLEKLEYKYKLTIGITPDGNGAIISKIKEIVAMHGLKDEWQRRRENMLKEMIDVTPFIANMLEKFSSRKMKLPITGLTKI
ncbi:MAG: hypothetical protein VX767_03660, partial [Candidatus Neomarinimicrobiota bacterium]|nr:hypothetical protein [Candidatus Neomarinimicrobiota bacterium]